LKKVRWLTADEMRAWRGFISTSPDLQRVIERDLSRFGLDAGDYQLLAMLSEAPDHRLRMSDLADELRLTRGGLTRRMKGVIEAGLVERIDDKDDKRVAYAHLTSQGWRLIKRIAPHHVETVRAMMIDLLSPAEVKALGNAFEKISSHLRKCV
jgi:DNA-binding MarR family transcriptional regulator